MAVDDQRHAPAALSSGERPGTDCTGKPPRAGLGWYGKSPLTGTRHPDRPARGDALCRLRYPFTMVSDVEQQPGMETVYNGAVLAGSSLAGSSTGT